MCEELYLERLDNRTSWGFRLTGGFDLGTPLSIIKVTGGSIAELCGVQVGDLVQEINGQSTKNFTHKDAQNCIAQAKNHLRLVVMRGSIVTPPSTPLRGMTPDVSNLENGHCPSSICHEELNDRFSNANSMKDGLKKAPITQMKTGTTATLTKPKYSVNEKGQLLDGDRVMNDVEIAELLTGNEEVLDEGVLGINFKKFLPQVDFIRKSEVFKLLQNENTKKEISEQMELKKNPNKRFSTFLQRPSTPKDSPDGPKFVRFKPPRFLPKQPEKKFEWPVLKHWEKPKKPPPEPPSHTVLWLFMEESGEEIIGGRWGTEEEERKNLSKNSYIEYDRESVCSSIMKFHDEDDAISVTSKEFEQELQMSKADENINGISENDTDKHDEKKLKYSWYIEQQEGDIGINEANLYTQDEISCKRKNVTDIRENITDNAKEEFTYEKENTFDVQGLQFQEEYYANKQEEIISSTNKEISEKKVCNKDFLSQLNNIQYQIQALEGDVSTDVLTQLHAVKEQLSKIVNTKTTQETATDEKFEVNLQGKIKTGEQVIQYEKINTGDKDLQGIMGNKEITSRETAIHQESRTNVEENVTSGVVTSEAVTKKGNITETVTETTETFEAEIHEHEEFESTELQIEGFKEYHYEIVEAPEPEEEIITIPIKKKITPITPQRRPIVLPGGRMWRKPKDAEHEEFYQGILVAQAEVLVGSTENLNYTKYLPPKIDMTSSEVYRLIHETEDPVKKKNLEEILQETNYCQPISKRHFYAATLREPPPIGTVEFSDL